MTVADPTSIRVTRYVPEEHLDPEHMSERQQAFLWLQVQEAFYGGAAGGGKSDALLMGALQYVDVPGYAAILFRRTYTDLSLPGALMDRSHEWLDDSDATWVDRDKTWEFPGGGTLTFGYLKNWRDKFRYRSAEFQYIGFDELTEFPEDDYRFLFTRLRRPKKRSTGRHNPLASVPLRMRSASNPGGIGHKWVKERMVDERSPTRVFVPAKLWDNPNIDHESYVESLNQLDAQTRAQYLEGDWSVRPAGDWYFDHDDIAAAVELGRFYDGLLENGELEPAGRLGAGVDWGENTQGYAVWPLEGGGIYIPPSEVFARGIEPAESTRRMLVKWTRFEVPLEWVAYDAAGIQSMRTFVATARATHPRLKSIKVAFSKYKAETAKYMLRLFERTGKDRSTRVIAISPHNRELVRQLPELKRDPEGTGAWLKEDDQHGPDALIAGIARVARRNRRLTA